MRPATQLERLVTWLRARAARGLPIPSTAGITTELEFGLPSRVTELLRQAEAQGLLRVLYGANNGIAAIEAADGSWRAERGGPPKPPERKCLRCRRPFQPEHRHNFLCGCGEPRAAATATAAQRAEA